MLGNRKTLALFIAATCATTPLAVLPQSIPGDSCSNINVVGVGCATFRFVGVERGKPFIAQRVVTSTSNSPDGTIKKVEWTEFTARDTEGRIRFEQKEAFKAPDWRENGAMINHDIEKIVVPTGSLGSLVTILIASNAKAQSWNQTLGLHMSFRPAIHCRPSSGATTHIRI